MLGDEGDLLVDAAFVDPRQTESPVRLARLVAEALQRSMLPEELPEMPGFKLEACYRAAAGGARIAGDWYDVIPLSSGRVGAAIGDVAGSGVGAATQMGRLRSALRAFALGGAAPTATLDSMNQYMREFEPDAMASLAYAVIEPDGMVLIANAGHSPPLLLEPGSGGILVHGTPAPPLGVSAYPGYEAVMVTLAPSSSLVLYTDGLVERRGSGVDDGLERLLRAARRLAGSPGSISTQLVEAMLEREVPTDDVAVLTVKLDPSPSRFERSVPADPRELAPLRQSLSLWLTAFGLGQDETYDVLAACEEACSNAIQHAHPARDSSFTVVGTCEAGTLEITVSDSGAWRRDSPGSGGRGMRLMQGLMDSVEVRTGSGGSTVTLRRNLAGAGPH